ncbi:hypothetical protein [Klebsiella quasipneumoniae]|uniref:hypothetical protein n=1 Tax=Klebsiella quasipneumoniae TaxID=1463165 RepID=UPI0013A03D4A|nr:hypothetical protein [Klebsiella quasipneumoniae]MVX98545.1 hypothetical protein [Enterobacteriaceae bacterium 8376wB9]
MRDLILQLSKSSIYSTKPSTGLSHPSDKDRAKRIFADLKKQGLKASEEAIRQFAVNNGWDPVRAQELASFAKKYVG